MGRRKIEIKAIKDDRNRSVTFLKRKGGLFKKAHELSVLCSVDVAVFIFGSNKKLYEYSSRDMHELINRYSYHGGPNEHKGPSDFNGNGGGDDDDDEDLEGTPPHHEGSVEPQILPPHFQGQPNFAQLRQHHTPSASPPIGGIPFVQRSHTPQMPSRPSSRTDYRPRPAIPQPPTNTPGPQPVMQNGFGYLSAPGIYHPHSQPSLQHGPPPAPAQYQYAAAAHPPQMSAYMEDPRRAPGASSYPPQPPPRPQPSPPQVHVQQLPQPVPHMSPPQPSSQHLEVPVAAPQKPHIIQHHIPEPLVQPPTPTPAPMDPPKSERLHDRPAQPGLDTSNIRKLPRGHQSGSIFTPIDDNRSILGQHLDSFHADAHIKEESGSRAQSVDASGVSRIKSSNSPPMPQRANTGVGFPKARGSISIPEGGFTPPSRSNSMKIDGASRPRLRVQIPDEASDAGSNTGEPATTSPRGTADVSAQPMRRNGADAPRLPPPSPSATTILSAGATGPPNPFARPPPQTHSGNMDIGTPVSALPSRFLNTDFLPSPSTFYPEWNFRGDNNNTTMPSPLNFATPVAGSGPSFLRDDGGPPNAAKRKSPEISTAGPHSEGHEGFEPKRIKVDG